MQTTLLRVAILLFVYSCTNGPDAAFKEGAAPRIRADYKIWSEEGDSLVTAMLQFYSDSQKNKNLLLQPPASVQLDGQPLAADSAGITGAYYELQAAQAGFAGKHIIELAYTDGRSFSDTFSFYPFTLAQPMPAVLEREDFILPLNGLPDGSLVRMVLTDTAFDGKGINEIDTVKKSALILPLARLRVLAPGPVTMHLFAEDDRPLRSKLRGRLSVSYGLSRTFELRY